MTSLVDDERTNGTVTLTKFVQECQSQITNKTLKPKKYQKVVNNLLFELSATIHWFHTDVKCCHLELTPSNILIENGEIKDGEINPQIKILLLVPKVTELPNITTANAELFKSPNVLKGEFNDIRSKDMYGLGVIAYFCFFGDNLFDKIKTENEENRGSIFYAIKNGKLKQYLTMNNLLKAINPKIFSLLTALLTTDELQRLDSYSVIKHKFFKYSLKKYGNITDKIGCHKKCKSHNSCQIAEDLLTFKQDNAVSTIAFTDICIRD